MKEKFKEIWDYSENNIILYILKYLFIMLLCGVGIGILFNICNYI